MMKLKIKNSLLFLIFGFILFYLFIYLFLAFKIFTFYTFLSHVKRYNYIDPNPEKPSS